MKHGRLFKYPKRFCTECNSDQYVYVFLHKTFDMYKCQTCNAEVCRVGDGEQKGIPGRVRGGIDIRSLAGDSIGGRPSEILAKERVDILSDEHCVWEPTDYEAEEAKEARLYDFKRALPKLTVRQREVVDTIDIFGSQAEAARRLGISPQAIGIILKQAQRKIEKCV